MEILHPKTGESVLDCTVGLGGHTAGFLEKILPKGYLIGIDADEENLRNVKLKMKNEKCVTLLHANFRDIQNHDFPYFDIIFADLGLSSPHVDDPGRGFTYREDIPLDLRFDRSKGETASEFIARIPEGELAGILKEYGEIRQAKKYANMLKKSIVRTTFDVKCRVPHTLLPQIFQALRTAVNDELGALKVLLEQGPRLLKPGGRFGVISYHSLEDRMVKKAFRAMSASMKDTVTGAVSREAAFLLLTKKPVRPSNAEVEKNPRARSAKFRVIQRRCTLDSSPRPLP